MDSKNLLRYKERKYSQHGEEGMINELIGTIPLVYRYSVEVGASNGIDGSNTRLFMENGWTSMFIESDKTVYDILCKNTKDNYPNAICLNIEISLDGENNLNSIFKKNKTPIDFDILSLDIEGNEYWIWKDLKYDPKIVVIEYNGELKDQNFIQEYKNGPRTPSDSNEYKGAGALALNSLGQEKGYDLVGITRPNMIFIKKELNQFNKIENVNSILRNLFRR